MKTYPVCLIGMQARHAVVVGGGRVAARKVKDLLEAGGHVTVISPKLTPELQSLVDDGQVTKRNKSVAWSTWWTTQHTAISSCPPSFDTGM
jgi:precorrin-2 dehydrogenase/sirohydrochlorin ferrochelatase